MPTHEPERVRASRWRARSVLARLVALVLVGCAAAPDDPAGPVVEAPGSPPRPTLREPRVGLLTSSFFRNPSASESEAGAARRVLVSIESRLDNAFARYRARSFDEAAEQLIAAVKLLETETTFRPNPTLAGLREGIMSQIRRNGAEWAALETQRLHAILDAERSSIAADEPVTAPIAALQVAPVPRRAGPRLVPSTWMPSTLPPHTTRLLVREDHEIPLDAMHITAEVDGDYACVLVSLGFTMNDIRAPIQGEIGRFSLRLPDLGTLHTLAFGPIGRDAPYAARSLEAAAATGADSRPTLDQPWNRAVRPAVIVPREPARTAFEATVTRWVDPAIAEWSGAGVFDVRLYPLRPGTRYQVLLAYDLPLTVRQGRRWLALDLPPSTPFRSCDIGVAHDRGMGFDAKELELTNLYESPDRRWIRVEPRAGVVQMDIDADPVVLTDDDPAAGPCFAARLTPKLPATADLSGPRRAVFMIDRSRSCDADHLARSLELMGEILTRHRATLADFAVLFYASDATWWRTAYTPNSAPEVERLLADGRALVLEGATDLAGALAVAARPTWPLAPPPDAVFLLGTGAASCGTDDAPLLADMPPVYAYELARADAGAHRLARIARATGGAVFAVDAADLAATAHAHARAWTITSVTLPGASDVLIRGSPTAIGEGQTLHVAGRGRIGPAATLELTLERRSERTTVNCPLGRPVPSPIARRLYGQAATRALELAGPATADLAVHYASHFRVVGPSTSLLMLESEADYRRNGIDHERDAAVHHAAVADRPVMSAIPTSTNARGHRERFMTWLERRRSDALAQGVELTLPPALRVALEQLPDLAFTPPGPESGMLEPASGLLAAYRVGLENPALTHATRIEEALRRDALGDLSGALRCLSTPLVYAPDDVRRLREVGYHASARSAHGLAYAAFARMVELRPTDPAAWIDLAACLAGAGKHEMALAAGELASASPWPWPAWSAATGEGGWTGADLAAAAALVTLPTLDALATGQPSPLTVWVVERRDALRRRLAFQPLDLAVVIAWADGSADVDLSVAEPSGDVCDLDHRVTKHGGWRSTNAAGGPGPEVYVVPKAAAGRYAPTVQLSRFSRVGLVCVRVSVHRDWGRPEHTVRHQVLWLDAKTRTQAVVPIELR